MHENDNVTRTCASCKFWDQFVARSNFGHCEYPPDKEGHPKLTKAKRIAENTVWGGINPKGSHMPDGALLPITTDMTVCSQWASKEPDETDRKPAA